MKCRWPMPGTGAFPTRLGAMWKWLNTTVALMLPFEWTMDGPLNLTDAPGADGAVLFAGLAGGADTGADRAWPPDPPPATAGASTDAIAAFVFIANLPPALARRR